MAQLVAKRYAKALFELAVEENNIDGFYEQYLFIVEAMKQEKDFFTVFSHPQIIQEEKQKMMQEIFKNSIQGKLMGFLHILIEKSREAHIIDIFQEFEALVKNHKNVDTAYVESAVALSENQLGQLKNQLELQTSKKIEMNLSVNPALLAGLTIRVGDLFIDGSILGKMNKMKETLKRVQLAKEGV